MILMHLVNLVIMVDLFFSDETDDFGESIEKLVGKSVKKICEKS